MVGGLVQLAGDFRPHRARGIVCVSVLVEQSGLRFALKKLKSNENE